MKIAAKEDIRNCLINWYQKHHRKLPWRETDDPYHIWVSEVMLQQTQVKTVIPYYEKFIRRFPDIRSLAEADLQHVLKIWEGLGYYARARNLHRAARQVLTDYDGKVPDSIAHFMSLTGVGDYIASAVQSIAFNQCHAVVDGNVKRVMARLFKISAPVNQSRDYQKFKKIAQELLDPELPGIFNQAVMELGALICKPTKPDCAACPIQSVCMAYRSKNVNQYPVRIRRKPTPRYHLAVGVVKKKNRLLIIQRKPEGLLGGLWEFPGGEVQKNEPVKQACIRSIKEAVNLTVDVTGVVTQVKHAYTHFRIVMDVFYCDYVSGRVKLNGAADYRWIHLRDIDAYPFHKANHKFIQILMTSHLHP